MLNTLKPVMLVAAMALAPLAGHAATVTMSDGGSYAVNSGDLYNFYESSRTGTVNQPDFADNKLEFTFSDVNLPSTLFSASTYLSLRGSITNLVMSWLSGSTVLSSVNLGTITNGVPSSIGGNLNTTLTLADNPQTLRVSWDSLQGTVDANVQVAAVPVPAAGGLLLLALAGLGLARRRKSV